jgi:hypothetical protein
MEELKKEIEKRIPFVIACLASLAVGSIASHYARPYSPAIFMLCGYCLPKSKEIFKKLIRRK